MSKYFCHFWGAGEICINKRKPWQHALIDCLAQCMAHSNCLANYLSISILEQSLLTLIKISCWDFTRNCVQLVNQFEENKQLYCVESFHFIITICLFIYLEHLQFALSVFCNPHYTNLIHILLDQHIKFFFSVHVSVARIKKIPFFIVYLISCDLAELSY